MTYTQGLVHGVWIGAIVVNVIWIYNARKHRAAVRQPAAGDRAQQAPNNNPYHQEL